MITCQWDARQATEHELANEHREAVQYNEEHRRDLIQEEALRRGISIPQLEEIR